MAAMSLAPFLRAGVCLCFFTGVSAVTPAQTSTAQPETFPTIDFAPRNLVDLPLDAARRRELEKALARQDYKQAEQILVDEIERDSPSARTARLLIAAGGIFFLDQQYLNAAIAWKKAEAIAPLDERTRFSLAMAYIKLNRSDWARPELGKLAAAHPRNSTYQYWLARLDYGAQDYPSAIAKFKKVIELDPQMMRAFDSLGLCYDYLGQYDEAIKHYGRAITLNRRQPRPSPWPHVNLAISLMAVNQLTAAEKQLREAVTYDARLPQAHYQLGQVLEKQNKYVEAVKALEIAASLDAAYAEPHYSLGRLYQRQGDREKARKAIERFRELKKSGS